MSTTRKRKPTAHASVSIPPGLCRYPRFPELWKEWLEYKSERGEFYTQRGLNQTFTVLQRRGPASAADSLQLAMAMNWQGPAADDALKKYGLGEGSVERDEYGYPVLFKKRVPASEVPS